MQADIPLGEPPSINRIQDPEIAEEEDTNDEADVVRFKGEPIIMTGRDVSRFVVDLRDDGDPALTFRSLVIGTLFACVGAANTQANYFMPKTIVVSMTNLLLLIYLTGKIWSKVLPRRSRVEGTQLAVLGPLLELINHGDFRIKEHAIGMLITGTASFTFDTTPVSRAVVQHLYYNTTVHAMTPILAGSSIAGFSYGLCGLLRPLTVYPSEMVYWGSLPVLVTILQSLHFYSPENQKRMKLFLVSFVGMFLWQIIPSYIFPLLNSLSIFCLASQYMSSSVQNVFTNLFGGGRNNEGLGLLSICLNWQYITLQHVSYPLIQQANSWIGYGLCYIVLSAIYYFNIWNSKGFPLLSTSMFYSNGSVFDLSAMLGVTFQINQTAINEVGMPQLTGSNLWYNIASFLSIGGLFAHCLCFWGPNIIANARLETHSDPHWKVMQRYKEVPYWWYIYLMTFSFLSGFIVVLWSQATTSWYSYIVALLLGSFVTPFSQLLYACMGTGISTNQLMVMVGGFISPGDPVANLYFTMWSHGIIVQCITFSGGLKVCQYLKVPPREAFIAQIWGTVLGVVIQYIVMVSIVSSHESALLNTDGKSIWSGETAQDVNNTAMTWSLAKELYGLHGQYFIVVPSLLFGMAATIIQWLFSKRWPRIGPVQTNNVILPIIYMYSASLSSGVTSFVTSAVLVGIISQFWLRNYHPGWFRKYNYILGAALDAGSQAMTFILSFTVFGALGQARPFPSWAGNPSKGNSDYCNGNGALT